MKLCNSGKKLVFFLCLSLQAILISTTTYSQCAVNAGNDTTICQGTSLVRTATVAPAGAQIQWYVQGNSTNILSTTATLNIIPTVADTFYYIIKVTSNAGGGCSDYDTIKVIVNPSPSIRIQSNLTTCQQSLQNITANYSPSNGTINWYAIGSTASLHTGATFTIPTSTSGTFDYVVKIDSLSTCSKYDTIRVFVNPKPDANFTFSVNCGRKISFTSTSTTASGTITNYQWNFGATGNNNTSNQQNPNHNYSNTPATYQVQLIVTNSFGCKDTIVRSVTTTTTLIASLAGNNPSAQIYNGVPFFIKCNPTATSYPFTFFNNSSTAASNTNTIINWGDGSANTSITNWQTGAAGQITHTYPVGSFNLTLYVNNGNCSDSAVYGVYLGNNPGGSISAPAGGTVGCTGSTFTFPFSGFSTNPPGTEYFIYINDGTDTIHYTQDNLPNALIHTFDSTSCGTTSLGIANSFAIYYLISNPCLSTPGNIGGIRISRKAKADFIYSPYDSICVNNTMTFTNTSIGGLTVGNTPTCTPGNSVWNISPNTGWTIVSGSSLGSDNGFPDFPDSWTSGTQTLQITFNLPGNYIIKLRTGNDQCGKDTMVKTICVNPIPTAAFTLNRDTICSNQTVFATGSTNTPSCGQNTFQYGVSYIPAPGCTPSISDYGYIDNTNSTSQNPHFQFVNPGQYIISLQTFAPNNRCQSAIFKDTVTVKSKPIISLSLPVDSICPPGTITPTFTSQCYVVGATYNWTITGGTSSSPLNTSTPPLISYSPANTNIFNNYNISVSAQNSCGTSSATVPIVIKPIPRIPSRKDSVCTGNAVSYTPVTTPPNIYAPTGTTYSWSIPTVTNGVTGAQSGNAQTSFNSGVLVNSSNTAQTIIFTITPNYKGCNGVQFNDTIKVKPEASIQPITAEICSGSAFSVTPSSASPNIIPVGTTYTWTVQDNPSITGETNQNNPQTTISQTLTNTSINVQTVVYTVTPKSIGCPGANFTVTVTVNPSPTAIASPQIICSGTATNIAITTNATSSSNVNYSWTFANNTNVTGAANGSGNTIAQTLNNTSVSAQNIVYTITPSFASGSVSCPGVTSTVTATVNPIPTVTAPSNLVLCNASASGAINFTGTVTGTIFEWANNTPSIGLAASGIGNISSFTATNSGTAPVTAIVTVTPKFTNASGPPTCNGTPRNFNITVNPTPTVDQPSPLTICNNASSGLIAFTSTVTGTLYDWTNSNTSIGLGASGTGNIPSFTGVNTGTAPITATITVTPKFTNSISATPTCSGTPKTFIITINPTPSATASPTSQTICSGTSTSISLTSNITNNVTFDWVPSVNTSIGGATSSSGSTISQTLTNSGNTAQNITYTITPTYINNSVGCSGGVINVVITVNPAPVVNQPVNLTFCNNTSTGLIGFSGPVTGTIFSWTNDNTAIGLAASGTGNISSFTATNSTNAPIVANITVNPSFPNSGGGSSCLGVSKTFTITINPTPGLSVTPNTQIICSSGQTNIVLSSNVSSGVTYAWTASSNTLGATSSSGNTISQTLNNTSLTPQNVTYTISPTYTGNSVACLGSSATAVITVNPIPNVNQPTPQTICNNALTNAITFGTTVTGTTFTWTNNNISIGLAANGTGNISAFTATNTTNSPITGVIQVTPTYTNTNGGSACTGTVKDFNIIVNPTPTSTAPTNLELCNGSPTGLITLTGNVSGSVYNWANNTTSIGLAATGTGDILSFNAINTTSAAITATITITPSFTNAGTTCTGSTSNFTIKVNPAPSVQFSQADQTICSGATSTVVNLSSATTGISYSWSSAAPSSITGNTANSTSNNIPVQTLISSSPTPQTVVYSVVGSTGGTSACPGGTAIYNITVNPKPTIGQIDLSTCSGVSFSTTPSATVAGNIIPTGTTYNWSTPVVTGGMTGGVSGNGTSISGTLINTTSLSQTATYTVTPTSGAAGSCVGTAFTVNVTVNPKPEIANITKTLCSDSSFNIVPTLGAIIPSGTTYNWSSPTLSVPGSITGGASSGGQQTSITGTLVNTTNTVQTATYTVTPSGNPGNCVGQSFTVTITLNPKPTIGGIQQTICSDSSFSIVPSSTVSSNVIPAGTTYSWSLPTLSQPGSITGATTSGGQQAAITDTLVNTTNTVQTATYTVTPSGNPGNCPGSPFTVTVTVNPKPTIRSVSYTICNGSTFSYQPSNNNIDSIVPVGTTYSWLTPTLSGIITGAIPGTNLPSVSGTLFNTTDNPQTATYTVTPYGPSGCKGNNFTVTVTVNPSPRVSFAPGPQTICSGDPTALVTLSSLTTGVSLPWDCVQPTGITGVITSGTGSIPIQILVNSTTLPITVTYIANPVTTGTSACPGVPNPYTIIVNPKPTIGQIDLSTCSGVSFSTTPSATVAGNIIPTGTTYNWSTPVVTGGMTGGVSGNGTSISGTLINTTSLSQTATYTVTPTSGAAGSCVGTAFTVNVTVNPKPEIANITKTLCSDSSFNIVPTLGAIIPSGTTYNWSSPTLSVPGSITGGASSGGQQTSITGTLVNTTNTVQTATYTVTPSGNPGNCVGQSFTVTIILNPKPTIGGIQQIICSDSSFSIVPSSTVSSNVIPAGTNYSWTLPSLSQSGSITGATTSGGQQAAITDTLVNTTNTVQTATYTVTPYGNPGNCPGVPFSVTVTVNPKPTIRSVSYTICSGSSFSYQPSNNNVDSIVPVGTTYSWSTPTLSTVGGITGSSAGNNSTSVFGTLVNTTDDPQVATYTVLPISPEGCKGDAFNVTVTVNPTPRVIYNPAGPQTICSGSPTTIISISSPTVGANINWTCIPPSDIDGAQTSGTNIIPVQTLQNNSVNPITVTYTAQATTSGTTACPGAPIPYNVIINPTPKISNKSYEICSGTSFTVGLTNNPPVEIIPAGTSYTWTISNNTNITGAAGQPTPISTISQTLTNLTNTPQSVIYTVTPTSGAQGNCVGSTFLVTVTVNPAPLFPTMHDTICSGTTFDTIPRNNPPSFIVPAGTQYSWGVPTMPLGAGPDLTSGTSGGVASGVVQSQIFGTLNNTAYNPLNVVYSVTPTSGNASGSACAGAPFDYIVTVNPLPVISNATLSQSICDSTFSSAVVMTSNTNNSTFQWSLSTLPTTITGQIASGITTIPSMQLFNAGIAQDSVLYQVVTSANRCSGPPVNYTIYVNPDATANYTFVQDTACWPFVIDITNTSPTTADSAYYWYANNTLIGTGYNYPGYTLILPDDSVLIRLITISKYGCKPDTFEHWFFTRHKPRPNFTFTYNPASGCGPNLVTFNNTTPYQEWFNYQWNFGTSPNPQTPAPNPSNSTLAQPGAVLFQSDQLNFTDAIYNVLLTVSNVCETKDTTLPVLIKSLPKAQFAPNQTNVCSNTNVIFTNTSQGTGNSYHWDFGDGTQTTTTNNNPVQHIYNVGDTATFYILLTATNSCGVDVDTVSIRVTPSTIDLNWFIVQNTQFGCAPHEVEIHNVSTGGTLFEWNFNDPNSTVNYISTLNSEVIYHTYTTPGIYNISVHAINTCSDTTGLDSIRVIRSPIPAFQVINNNACPWTAVSFTNQTDTATNYTWTFGDPASGLSNTSNQINPSHVYTSPGVYTVTLTANLIDISGISCPRSTTQTVNIVAPIAQINSNATGCIRDTILFTPVVSSTLGLAPLSDTIWQINGVPYAIPAGHYPNFSHVFTTPGNYTITLIVGTIYGCYDTVSTSITINTIPSIFASADQRICLGQSVPLNSNSNAGNYQWTPLSGLSCYTCPNPIASPVTTTNYVVSTLNSLGCKNTDTVVVTVIQPFEITVSPNDTICIGESTTLTVSGAANYTWTPSATLSCVTCPNPIATPQLTTTYTVVGSDIYRCFTDTGKIVVAVGMYPVVSLPSPQILSTGTLFPIISQITNGPIRNYIWTPTTDLNCINCPNPTAFIRKDICYSLEAENIYGCKGSDTFCIRVFCENTQTFIPNTFTPDGDGINDVFMVRGTGIKSVKQFRVFNRWGELIFEKSNFPPNSSQYGWNGKIRGVLATPDVFVYTAEVLCENDVPFTYKGNVTLIR